MDASQFFISFDFLKHVRQTLNYKFPDERLAHEYFKTSSHQSTTLLSNSNFTSNSNSENQQIIRLGSTCVCKRHHQERRSYSACKYLRWRALQQ